MKHVRLCVATLIIAVLLTACGGSNTTESNAPASDQATAVQDTAAQSDTTDAEQTTDTDTQSTESATSGDEWSGSNFNENIDSLKSYTATFTYEHGDGDAKQAWSWRQSVIREPLAIEMYTNDKGADSTAGSYHLVQIGDKMYSVTTDPVQCILVVNQPQNQGLQPDTFMTGLPFSMKKEGPGPDMFGNATDKFAYSGNELDGSSYQATALVDRAKGFAYSYDVSGMQKNGDAKEPFHWTYELTDVNNVPAITIPKECENVGSGTKWPLPEGAELTMQTNEMMSYSSTKPVKELADFYAEEMPKAGYTVGDGGMTTDDSIMAVYTKDSMTVTIIMTFQDGKTTVIITQQG